MTYSTTLIYSQSLLKRAVLSFWWRNVGTSYLVAVLVITSSLVYSLLGGNRSWYVGALATILAFAILFIFALYYVHYHNTINKFKTMGSETIQFTVEEDMFSFSSSKGSMVTLSWSNVTEIWQFETYWLMLFSKAQFSTLPLSAISSEMQSFIVKCIENAGGKIK